MKKFLSVVLTIGFVLTGTAFAYLEYGLSAGAKAPNFLAVDSHERTVKLSNYLRNGPVVLVFYRGGWCPYCNRQLQDYQSHYSEFKELGVNLIAMSVDQVAKASTTVEDQQLAFPVLSNPPANILRDYHLAYTVPDSLVEKYLNEYQIDLESASGRGHHIIAVPAIFIINQDQNIVYSYANEDYKVRKSSDELLTIIRSLKSAGVL